MSTLTLADGTVINTQTGLPVREDNVLPGYVAVPTHAEAVQEITRVRKKISDLPDVPEKMNIIAVVCAYHMFGLDDWEVAMAIGCTEKQVGNIRMSAAFTDMIDALRVNMLEGGQEDVRSMLAMQSKQAARTITNKMTSDDEKVALAAAKDILDRSGHRPADVIEHRLRVDGGLTIEYVSKADQNLPDIDLNAEDVTDV